MELGPQFDSQAVSGVGRREKLPVIKLHIAQYVITLTLIVLVAGLWRLQILSVDNFRALAEANRIRRVPVLAPRGRLFDREGRLLVDNYPSVSCFLLRESAKDIAADIPLIARGLHIPPEQIEAAVRRFQSTPRYQPIPLKQDITPDEQAFIAAHSVELPELETIDEQRRLYPQDGFAAHLIGYVGEISENDLNKDEFAFYEPGDVVGKSGVEETYDALLRGVDGSRDVIVNSHGKEIGHLGQTLAKPGQDLKLTIDLDLQMVAEKAMEGKTGALVALDPHTGEILALVSRPAFDPNQFAVKLSRDYWNQLLNNPDHPLMDKAIQAQLAPGSTFKIIMSYAGLEEGQAQDMRVMCAGGASFYGHFFKCDQRHGMVDIAHAIPWSCDTFFYTLANKLGIDTIARYATGVGLAQRTGVDLPDEASGTMPSTAWKMKTLHERWYAGEVISVGIGQGAVTVTPIQLARAIGGLASGGVFYRPHLVLPSKDVSEQELEDIYKSFPGSGDKTVPMKPENWQIITDAMAETTISGTAGASHLVGIDFAGKTGTAQVVSGDTREHWGAGRKTVPNSWFVGLAPRRNPDIVVVVLWENGYWGSNSAKLGAQIINAYVEKQRRREHNLRLAQVAPMALRPAPAETANP